MNERISIVDKKHEAKNQNLASQILRKNEISQSMNSPIDRVLFLQKTIGNQAVQRLIKSGAFQAKLRIGQPGDVYEQEADRVAEQVMRMPDVSSGKDIRVQRKCPRCPKGLTGLLGKDKKEENLLAKETYSKTPEVTPQIESNINSLKGGGHPLPGPTRAFFEPRFGHDFSRVRVHTDAKAAEAARSLNAKAYTVGRNVVFGAGQYAPGTSEGRMLMAHELTHVMQQASADPEHVDRLNERHSLSTINAFSGLKYTLQQKKSNPDTARRKCEVDPALDYYKRTPQGKKIDFNEWLEKMRKVAGTANKSLYDDAKAARKIDRSFIILVCKIQQLLNIREDGKIGGLTAIAFEKFATGGEKGIDYNKLFKDKKLEVGIAIGDEFEGEFIAIVNLLERAGKKLKNFSSTGSTGHRLIKFTKEFPVQGDNTAAPVAIEVEFNIISAESTTPKKILTEFLSEKEIVIYSGHARYGTGPDFDEKKSVKENFIIGVNSALHKAGRLSKGYDAHMNKILEGYGNDLEAMSKAGKIDPDKYQVWFFNACSTINYLDEVRKGLVTDKSGKIKSKANLRFVGTKHSIYSDAIKIVDGILNMKTMDQILTIMDINEKREVEARGEKAERSYYFSD